MRGKRASYSIFENARDCHYALVTMQKILFFQFGPQTFFLDNSILFKKQLILNSYEMVRLKEWGPK